MSKYKFNTQQAAEAAHNEVISNQWIGATTLDEVYVRINTSGLSVDLIIDIEKILKKHGGKAVSIL